MHAVAGTWALDARGRGECCKTSLSHGVVFLEIFGVLLRLQWLTAAPLHPMPLNNVVRISLFNMS